MRLPTPFPLLLLLATSAPFLPLTSAASDSWAPTKLTPLVPPPPPRASPRTYTETGLALLDVLNLSMYTATGLDIKKALSKASDAVTYGAGEDEEVGAVRLTDANWEEEVVFEDGEGAEGSVWAVIVHGPKDDPLTNVFYNAHAQAANLTRQLAIHPSSDPAQNLDLSHVKWGRIEFFNATELMTRWLVFKPPYLVFVSNRGKDLRFLAPREVRPDPKLLRQVLASGEWVEAPVWKSNWSPSGRYGPFLAKLAVWYRIWKEKTANIPRFAWLAISGVLSQSILAWLHRQSSSPPKLGMPGQDKPAAPMKKALTPIAPIAPAASEKAVAVAEAVRRRAAAAKEAGVLKAEQERAVAEELAQGKKGKGRK